MGEHGQGFLVCLLAVFGLRNPCPYVSVSSPQISIPESIFGVAIMWSQGTQAMLAEQVTNDVLLVITEGVAHLA
jgi:hypothetical protein